MPDAGAKVNSTGGTSQVMDERIVAAKFDSKDFEKGVDKTIKKLDELKKNLNLEQTGESVAELSKKTSKATEQTASAMEKLSERYTSFTGMLKQKLLSGLADQIVGIFFRMEKAALGFAKSMTFDQISAGLEKYESALTSVRMIVNSYKTIKNDITGLNEKVHYTQDEAYGAIKNLQTYADETSYSMAQMTDAMSKMVSAGVTLEQAEKNVQGIANACAAAGVNAQDASRAFYNLSQAYSSGSLKYTDYRSLQLLNMTNENFEEQLIAAGVKAGTLKETKDKNGNSVYVTQKSATNKKVDAGKKFTRSQVADYLRYGWAGTDVMDYLFGNNYYVDVQDFYDAKEAGDSDEARKKYLASLKDYDAMGKYIEGLKDDDERKQKYKSLASDEERKKYLNQLSDEADQINKIAKKYEGIDETALKKYLSGLDDSDQRKIKYRSLKTDKERKEYLKSLEKDADVIANVQGKEVGLNEEALENYIMSLDETNERRQKYEKMNTQQRKAYLKGLAEEAANLGKIGKKYSEISIEAFLAAREARNLQDVINAIADYVSSKWTNVFENLIGKLDDASKFFTQLTEGGIASFFTDFADWISDTSDSFNIGGVGSAAFREGVLELDGALGNLLGIFNDLLPDSTEFGRSLAETAMHVSVALQNFNEFTMKIRIWFNEAQRLKTIQTIFANLSGIFGIIAKTAGVAFRAISKALQTVAPIADAVFVALSKVTEPIAKLGDRKNTDPFDKLTEAVDNLFDPLNDATKILTPFITKVGEILGIVGDFFLQGSIDTLVANIEFFTDAFGLVLELLGIKSAQMKNGHGVLQGINEEITNLGNTCKGAIDAVSKFFTSLFADIRTLFGLEPKEGSNTIKEGGFFANIKNFFDTNEFIQNAEKWIADAKTNVTNWFDQATSGITAWFANLPETVGNIINGEFLKNVKTKKSSDKKEAEGSSDEQVETLYDWLENLKADLNTWWGQAQKDIKQWLADIPGKVSGFFTGFFFTKREAEKISGDHNIDGEYEYIETPLKVWLDGAIKSVTDFVTNIPAYLVQGLGKIGDIFVTITDFVFGQNKEAEKNAKDQNPAATAVAGWGESFLTAVRTMLTSIPAQVQTFLSNTKTNFKKVWGNLKSWFNESETGKTIKQIGSDIITGIKNFILKLPENLKNIVKGIGSAGRTIISTFKELFGTGEIADQVQNGLEKEISGISITGVLSSIADLGLTILNEFLSWFSGTNDVEENIEWFGKTIGGFIASIPSLIWNGIVDFGNEMSLLWDHIIHRLTGDENTYGSASSGKLDAFQLSHPTISKIVDSVIDWISNIPKTLKPVFEQAKTDITTLFNGFVSYWKNGDQIAGINRELAKENLPDSIRDTLLSQKATLEGNTDFEARYPALAKLVTSMRTWIDGIYPSITTAWDNAKMNINTFISTFGVFWKTLGTEGETEEETTPTEFEEKHPAIAGWVRATREWITQIPDNLTATFNSAKERIVAFWRTFTAFWRNMDRRNEIQSLLDENAGAGGNLLSKHEFDVLNKEAAAIDAGGTDFEKNHPAIAKMVQSLRTWLEGLPKSIENAWNTATEDLKKFWDDLVAAFNGETIESDKDADSQTLGARLKERITNFFANLPADITDGISTALGAINSGIGAITGLFASASAEDVSTGGFEEKLAAAAENVAGATEKAGEEIKDSPAQKFKDGLIKIGTAFKNLIGNTIPNFITEGFHWVRDNWDKEGGWKESLLGIFSRVTGIEPEEFKTENLKANIKKVIEDLPNTISQALTNIGGTLGKIFSGKKPLTESMKALLEADSLSDTIKNEQKELWESQGYDTDLTNWGIISSIEGIFTTIGEHIKDAFGLILPYVVDGFNWTVGKVGDLLGHVGKLISGEEEVDDILNNIFGEETGKKIKESLEKFVGTLGGFAKTALDGIGSVFAAGPNIIDAMLGLFTGGTDGKGETTEEKMQDAVKTTEEANKSADAVETNAVSMIQKIQEIIGSITTSITVGGVASVAGVIALGVILVQVLHAVRDVFSVADEVDAATQHVKWIGITTAIMGLVGLVGYMSYLASLDDDGKKLDKVREVVNELVTNITDIIGALSMLSFLNGIGKFFDWRDDAATSKLTSSAEGLGKIGEGLISGITNFVGALGLGGGIGIGAQLAVNGVSAGLDSLLNQFSEIGMMIDGFMTDLEPAIERVVNLGGTIDQAVESIKKMGNIFDTFVEIIGYMYNEEEDRDGVKKGLEAVRDENGNRTGWLGVIDNASPLLSMIYGLGDFMNNISMALNSLQNIDDPTDQMRKLKDTLLSDDFFDMTERLSDVMKEVFWNDPAYGKVTTDFNNVSTSLQVFGQALSLFVDSMQHMTPENVDEFNRVLTIFEGIVGASQQIGTTTGILDGVLHGADTQLTRAGRGMQSFAGHMVTFFEKIAQIKDIRGSEADSKALFDENVELVLHVGQGIAKIAGEINSVTIEALNGIGEQLPYLSHYIGSFTANLNNDLPTDITLERIEIISKIVTAIGELAGGIGPLGNAFGYRPEQISTFISEYARGLSVLLTETDTIYEIGKTTTTSLMNGIQAALTDSHMLEDSSYSEQLKTTGSAMAGYLAEGIQAAFDSEDTAFHPIIRPVLDDTSIRQQISGLFGVENSVDFNISSGFAEAVRQAFGGSDTMTSISTAVTSINDKISKLEEISLIVGSLQGEMTNVKDAFASMGVYLDGDELVGKLTPAITQRQDRDLLIYAGHVTTGRA